MKKNAQFLIFIINLFFLFTFSIQGQIGNFQQNTAYPQYSVDYTNRVFNKTYSSMPATSSAVNPGFITSGFLDWRGTAAACASWPAVSNHQHKGLDQGSGGQFVNLYSPVPGVVRTASNGTICIYNSAYNFTYIMVHCSTVAVSVNQNIQVGQYLGKTGAVGEATGVHLHSEVRPGNRTSASCPSSPIGSDPVYDPRITVFFFPICPTIPNTTAPTNAQSNVGIPINFDWTDAGGANPQYQIQISTTPNGWTAANGFSAGSSTSTTLRVNQGALTSSQFQWNTLPTTQIQPLPFTTYYYTVRSFSCGQNSNWSPIKSFTTGCIATTASLLTPSNGQQNLSAPVLLDWSNSTGTNIEYRIQVSTNPNTWTENDGFTTALTANPIIRVNQNTGSTSQFTWTSTSVNPPQPGVTYYWSVKTFACGNNAKWSPVRSFRIAPATNCITPTTTLSSPANAANINVGQAVNLTWSAVSSGCTIQEYQLQLTAPNGNTTNQSLTSPSFPFTAPANGIGTWQWRVRSRNSAGTWGVYSATRTFSIVQPQATCMLTLNRNIIAGGTVSGAGSSACGINRSISATPATGYSFVNWTEGTTPISNLANATVVLNSNRTLTANFIQNSVSSCISCPSHNFSLSINSSWNTHSSSIVSNGCKIYRFLAVPNRTYTFKTGCGNGATANFDTVIDLLNTSCATITSNNNGCTGGTSTVTWTCNYSTSGWVYVRVKGFSTAAGNFTLAYRETAGTALPSSNKLTEEDKRVDISLFPNPAFALVKLVSQYEPIQKVEIYDSQGRSVLNNSFNANEVEIDIQSLTPATYIVKVITISNQTKTLKFFKI